jgi:thiol:disulfide interchange protein DsbD
MNASHGTSTSLPFRPVRTPALGTLLAAMLCVVANAPQARAQFGGGGDVPPAEKLVKVEVAPITIAAGAPVAVFPVTLTIAPGWHVNANPPNPDYMIATALEVKPGYGVSPGKIGYPAPRPIKVGFEESPLFVYGDRVTLTLPLTAAANATSGAHTLKGTLRFQACNDQVCMAPASLPVVIAVTVTGGAVAGASDTTTAAPAPEAGATTMTGPGETGATSQDSTTRAATGFTTGPPPNGASAALDNPLARALNRGGVGAFLTLFVIGLALNLTPCVYPMLGVTVSIFGAKRAAPPAQVLGLAVLYVLGMAVMYSTLGLVAAFTGGLFGGMLQSPLIQVGIGVLLIVLALGMFGLYELQLPAGLLARLGGTTATSAAGVFASGLLVGVFAAPCIGPPVVALLAVVGAKGDPWFGFTSFFTLAMGLGAPYLILATFSNLIQTLPRSGEWMEWVKKVFGVLLVALGLFYALLALAPSWSAWVAPAALFIGGIYLGFFERSADKRPGFWWLKRLSGGLAIIVGVVFVATAPRESIAFEAFTAEALDAAVRSGTPVMLDFTANWCAPCHELERLTFTDRRVRDAARSFKTLRVDLTRYDSPEAEAWRRRFAIRGVPTVLFLGKRGDELTHARVEGFLPAEMFLERMKSVSAADQQAEGR